MVEGLSPYACTLAEILKSSYQALGKCRGLSVSILIILIHYFLKNYIFNLLPIWVSKMIEKYMMETFFVKRYMGVIPNRANTYTDQGKGEWWETPTVTKTSGEGFLYTILRDQLIFEKELQDSNQDLFIKSQKPIPESEIKTYGFGLKLADRVGEKASAMMG